MFSASLDLDKSSTQMLIGIWSRDCKMETQTNPLSYDDPTALKTPWKFPHPLIDCVQLESEVH